MKRIREIRPASVEASRHLVGVLGDLAAFVKAEQYVGGAFVVWDMRGNARSVYETSVGPFAAAMVPVFVHDALNRHVAVAIAQSTLAEPVDGEPA